MTTASPPRKPAPDPPERVSVQWIGPTGHGSVLFGELVPNRIYQCDPDLARVLVEQNARFWRTPEE